MFFIPNTETCLNVRFYYINSSKKINTFSLYYTNVIKSAIPNHVDNVNAFIKSDNPE